MSAVPSRETRFKRILFCTDFSASAEAAFDFAIDATIRRPGSTLCVLHVIHEVDAQFWKSYLAEVDDVEAQAKKAIDDKFAQAYLARVPAGLEVKLEIRTGPDASTILDFAEEQHIDLIIIGREGTSSLRKAFFGKVAEKIVRHAPCPVLVIPVGYALQPDPPANGHGTAPAAS